MLSNWNVVNSDAWICAERWFHDVRYRPCWPWREQRPRVWNGSASWERTDVNKQALWENVIKKQISIRTLCSAYMSLIEHFKITPCNCLYSCLWKNSIFYVLNKHYLIKQDRKLPYVMLEYRMKTASLILSESCLCSKRFIQFQINFFWVNSATSFQIAWLWVFYCADAVSIDGVFPDVYGAPCSSPPVSCRPITPILSIPTAIMARPKRL